MNEIICLLQLGEYSCVVRNYGEVFTFIRPGVADLYHLVTGKPCFLKDAAVADKVIGKGAAALMILGGVKEVYAEVISLSALMLLRDNGVETDFKNVVPFIWNRNRTDWCPLERICYEKDSPEEILPLIKEFMEKMQIPADYHLPLV